MVQVTYVKLRLCTCKLVKSLLLYIVIMPVHKQQINLKWLRLILNSSRNCKLRVWQNRLALPCHFVCVRSVVLMEEGEYMIVHVVHKINIY